MNPFLRTLLLAGVLPCLTLPFTPAAAALSLLPRSTFVFRVVEIKGAQDRVRVRVKPSSRNSPRPPPPSGQNEPPDFITYTVMPGDTIERISLWLFSSGERIRQVNLLPPEYEVVPGQQILLPMPRMP